MICLLLGWPCWISTNYTSSPKFPAGQLSQISSVISLAITLTDVELYVTAVVKLLGRISYSGHVITSCYTVSYYICTLLAQFQTQLFLLEQRTTVLGRRILTRCYHNYDSRRQEDKKNFFLQIVTKELFTNFQKSEITMEVDGWVQVSLGIFFWKIIPK